MLIIELRFLPSRDRGEVTGTTVTTGAGGGVGGDIESSVSYDESEEEPPNGDDAGERGLDRVSSEDPLGEDSNRSGVK